jgi:hypothetical protein
MHRVGLRQRGAGLFTDSVGTDDHQLFLTPRRPARVQAFPGGA